MFKYFFLAVFSVSSKLSIDPCCSSLPSSPSIHSLHVSMNDSVCITLFLRPLGLQPIFAASFDMFVSGFSAMVVNISFSMFICLLIPQYFISTTVTLDHFLWFKTEVSAPYVAMLSTIALYTFHFALFVKWLFDIIGFSCFILFRPCPALAFISSSVVRSVVIIYPRY